jgi:hypothetical protein
VKDTILILRVAAKQGNGQEEIADVVSDLLLTQMKKCPLDLTI